MTSAQKVVVDLDLLEQAANNLFDNAAKYSYPNTVVRIYANTTRAGRYQIAVASKGLRLEGREVPMCVQRGWRSDLAKMTTGEGSGIGLYVADQIMKAMGGELLVASTQPDGVTEFRLSFPLRGS